MACIVVGKQRSWGGSRDGEGHREYKIRWLVRGLPTDGPYNALNAAGLPLPGVPWSFDGDSDPWAFCLPDATVSICQEREGDPNQYWIVEQTFSTRPIQNCADESITDPLLQPPAISGGFNSFTEEATTDRHGNPTTNSAFEQLRGPQNEWDANRPTVKIQQNVADLQLDLLAMMVDTVNDAPLWGFPARCIKLRPVPWEEKYYGTCSKYFSRTLEFEVVNQLDYTRGDPVRKTWDRDVLDEGTKVIRGHWDTQRSSPTYGQYIIDPDEDGPFGLLDPNNPKNFIRFKDFKGENTKVILNGHGAPWDPDATYWWAVGVITDGVLTGVTAFEGTYAAAHVEAAENPLWGPFRSEEEADAVDTDTEEEVTSDPTGPGKRHVEKYDESNFLLLGIPVAIGV